MGKLEAILTCHGRRRNRAGWCSYRQSVTNQARFASSVPNSEAFLEVNLQLTVMICTGLHVTVQEVITSGCSKIPYFLNI
jgi:hypothetical protein